MRTRRRTLTLVACAGSTLICTAAVAQQPLAMTYGLDMKPEAARSAPAAVNRCAGFNWMSSIGACGRELFANIAERVAQSHEAARAAAAPAKWITMGVGGDESAQAAEEPAAQGSTGDTRAPRYVGMGRNPDVSLRLGSRHRMRGVEEVGFNDTTYQTHLQNNGHKAVGVELLVPFQ